MDGHLLRQREIGVSSAGEDANRVGGGEAKASPLRATLAWPAGHNYRHPTARITIEQLNCF